MTSARVSIFAMRTKQQRGARGGGGEACEDRGRERQRERVRGRERN